MKILFFSMVKVVLVGADIVFRVVDWHRIHVVLEICAAPSQVVCERSVDRRNGTEAGVVAVAAGGQGQGLDEAPVLVVVRVVVAEILKCMYKFWIQTKYKYSTYCMIEVVSEFRSCRE